MGWGPFDLQRRPWVALCRGAMSSDPLFVVQAVVVVAVVVAAFGVVMSFDCSAAVVAAAVNQV